MPFLKGMKLKMQRVIFHIDANSAFLSWSAVKLLKEGKEDIRNVPSVVGGDESKRHGIVLAKSIPAKAYGITTGEALFTARQKCRELIVVSPEYELYTSFSDAMAELLSFYSPIMQRYSVDECFLDYTGMEPHFGKPLDAANMIRERIKNELGFTVNVGIGPNKLLAKMASELKKPDKTHCIFHNDIKEKMWPLPIEELFMLGYSTAKELHKVGIHTIEALANTDISILIRLFKDCRGKMLYAFANGLDNSPVMQNSLIPVKGFSNSTTTSSDVTTIEDAKKVLLSLCDTVTYRLRKQQFNARVIALELKSSRFEHFSMQKTLDNPSDSLTEIYEHSLDILNNLWNGEPLRALGVRLTMLNPSRYIQNFLFSVPKIERLRKLDLASDKVRKKYGKEVITRATIMNYNRGNVPFNEELRGMTTGF